jgi:RNA polymerase sigma-70 factor (sigma-E family)
VQLFRPHTTSGHGEGVTVEGDGFEVFVRARSAALLRYGYVLSGNAHDAADLTQEALARLGASWSRVRHKADPESYVRTTMARLHISWWRRTRREHIVDDVPDQGYVDAALERADGDAGLWRALGQLPPRQRAVLVLRYYEQLDDESIAELIGCSPATVRSHASRALKTLRLTSESQHRIHAEEKS